MKDKATSPEHQEKPTYKIQVEAEKFADSQFTIPYEEMDEFNHAKYTGIMIGYNCAASKANARISELEKELCDTKANLGRAYNGLEDLKKEPLYERVKKIESEKTYPKK